MRDDPEDPERDDTSRLEGMKESGVDPNYYLIINGFALFVYVYNPMLLLKASKGY